MLFACWAMNILKLIVAFMAIMYWQHGVWTAVVPAKFSHHTLFKRDFQENYNLGTSIDGGSGGSGSPSNLYLPNTQIRNLRFSELDHEPRIYLAAPSGVPVVKLRAFHIDDPFVKIFYSIKDRDGNSNDANYFKIDSESGQVTTKRYIDRQVGSIYEVTVSAFTRNHDQESISLTIRVTEYNKFPPHFPENMYRADVGLVTPVGTEILRITADDGDKEPYNAEIYYSLQTRSPVVNINKLTGSIILKENLSPQYKELDFVVIAQDGGSPIRNSRTKLLLAIKYISEPQNVTVEHTGDQWAMLCWKPPISGTVYGYLLVVNTDYSPAFSTTRNISMNELGYKGNGRLCSGLGDLDSWSNYEVKVAGWNHNEIGLMSPPVKFSTKVNRTCYNINNSEYKCSCSQGFYGTNCTMFNPCTGNTPPCMNNGKCISHGDNQYYCECALGYEGRNCEQYNPCKLSKCENNSTCYLLPGDMPVCNCSVGYTGEFCEKLIDECSSFPCLNEGTCSNSDHGYVCNCHSGFEGKQCEVNIDDCESNLCQNNARCIDKVDSYLCDCPPGFIGDLCEYELNECSSNPCGQNATCIDKIAGYSCACPSGFEGDHCEQEINECSSSPCVNFGLCVDLVNGFQCKCLPKFTGRLCEQDLEKCPEHTVVSSKGTFLWPSVEVGVTAVMECPYGTNNINGTIYEVLGGYRYRKVNGVVKSYQQIWGLQIIEYDELYLHSSSVDRVSRQVFLELRLQNLAARKGQAVAVRTCILTSEGTGSWGNMLDRLCKEEEMTVAEKMVQNLESITKIPEEIDELVILRAKETVQKVVKFAQRDINIAQTMITVLSNLLEANVSVFNEADNDGTISFDIMKSIQEYTSNVELPSDKNINITSRNIALKVIELDFADLSNATDGLSFWPDIKEDLPITTTTKSSVAIVEYVTEPEIETDSRFDTTSSVITTSSTTDSTTTTMTKATSPDHDFVDENEAFDRGINASTFSERTKKVLKMSDTKAPSILIPQEALLKAVRNDTPSRFEFIWFRNKLLLREINSSDVEGDVIIASIRDTNVSNLEEPLVYNIPVYSYFRESDPICVFWDQESSEWSSRGITTLLKNNFVQCRATHMTAFSVLLDPTPRSRNNNETLSIISYIGAIFSIIGLSLTIFTYSIFRSLNRDRSGKILLNLCSSLLMMNLTFVALSRKDAFMKYMNKSDVCIVIALSSHYFVLTSLAWMLIEATNMHQLLITVFASSESKYLLKRMLLAWGLPLIVVGATIAYTGRDYYKPNDPDFCIFSPPNDSIYYISYLVPASIILIINVGVFLRVSRVLCIRHSVVKNASGHATVTASQVRGAFTVMTLLGVTWILGIFSVGDLREIFQYVFSITNSLQGFIIFIVRCVQYPEARSAWSTLFRTGKFKQYRGTVRGVPSSPTASSSQQTTRVTGRSDMVTAF